MKRLHLVVCLGGAASGWLSVGNVAGAAEERPQNASSELEEVVVTSTRVARDGYDAPTPTTVIGEALLQTAVPATLVDALALLPAFRNVATTGTANQSVAGTGGQSFVNLRGLGATRTLVLLNGERMVPTTSNATLDVSLLPSGLVKNIDVVTGGASAAWGSDAVAGVVNFLLDDGFVGFKSDVQGGVSSRGDNESGKVSVTWGERFADDRLHVLLSGEYYTSDGVPARSRPWSSGGSVWNDIGNPAYTPTNGQPQFLRRENFYFGNSTFGGVIVGGPLAGTQFLPGGSSAPFTFCNFNGPGGQLCDTPQDLPHFNYVTLMATPQDRSSGYGRISFDVTPDVEIYATGLHAESDTQVQTAWASTNLAGILTISRQNAYLPADIAQRMDTLGVTSFNLGRTFRDFPEASIRRENTLDTFSVGSNARLGDWQLKAYGSYGTSHNRVKILNNTVPARLRFAVDSIAGPGGSIVCRSTLTTPADGCVPLNPFGEGSSSQAAIDYATATTDADLRLQQLAFGTTLNGEPAATWAGPVSLAVGAEYRRQDARQDVDALSMARAFMLLNPQPLRGDLNVKEAFAETVIPLSNAQAWAGALDLNAAVRYTDYSTSGEVTTWKTGVTYSPVNEVTLRATRSRDIRAPNILELFQSPTQGTSQIVDPRTGLTDTFQGLTGGNTALEAEIADTIAAGIVYRPAWLDGFATSLDYYRIEIDDAIATLTAQDIVNRCERGLAQFCPLVHRDASGDISSIDLFFLNFQKIETSGFDLETSYRTDIGSGVLTLRALANYVDEYLSNDGNTKLDLAGSIAEGLPRWSWTLSTLYTTGPWTFMLNGDRIGGGKWSSRFNYENNSVEAVWYLDATVEMKLPFTTFKDATAYLNVSNLLDEAPPFGTGFQNGNYDRIGQTFKLGLRFSY